MNTNIKNTTQMIKTSDKKKNICMNVDEAREKRERGK